MHYHGFTELEDREMNRNADRIEAEDQLESLDDFWTDASLLCEKHFGSEGGDYAYEKINHILMAFALELRDATRSGHQ